MTQMGRKQRRAIRKRGERPPAARDHEHDGDGQEQDNQDAQGRKCRGERLLAEGQGHGESQAEQRPDRGAPGSRARAGPRAGAADGGSAAAAQNALAVLNG